MISVNTLRVRAKMRRRGWVAGTRPTGRSAMVDAARRTTPSRSSEPVTQDQENHGHQDLQADLGGTPPRHRARLLDEITRSRRRRRACSRPLQQDAAVATTTATRPRATAAAVTSGMYRVIDFQRDKDGVPGQGRLDRVRPEPLGEHRAAALRRRREALHPRAARLCRSARRCSRARRPSRTSATAMPLADIPVGMEIHNVELQPGKGAQICRSAGSAAQLTARGGSTRS